MTLKNEILGTISYQEYDDIPAVRGGYLSKIAEYPANIDNEIEDTAAMKFGRAFDDYLTRGDAFFKKNWFVSPMCKAILKSGMNVGLECGKVAKYRVSRDKWYCGQHAQGFDKAKIDDYQFISMDDFDMLLRMVAAVESHEYARELIAQSDPQVGITWKDEETGLWCKALLDFFPKIKVTVNLKTTTWQNVKEPRFVSHARGMLYHMSSAMALDGLRTILGNHYERCTYLVVGKHKTGRCPVELYDLPDERLFKNEEQNRWIERKFSRQYGFALYRHLLKKYAACQAKEQSGVPHAKAWPPYNWAGSREAGEYLITGEDDIDVTEYQEEDNAS